MSKDLTVIRMFLVAVPNDLHCYSLFDRLPGLYEDETPVVQWS